jgi:hypothetical protein
MWVLIDVGCIECGEQTNVLAVHSDEGKAYEAFQAMNRKLCKSAGRISTAEYGGTRGYESSYFDNGQHSLELHYIEDGQSLKGDSDETKTL